MAIIIGFRWLLHDVLFWTQPDERCFARCDELQSPFRYCGARSVVAMIYPVRVWVYSVCSRDFSVRILLARKSEWVWFSHGCVPASECTLCILLLKVLAQDTQKNTQFISFLFL